MSRHNLIGVVISLMYSSNTALEMVSAHFCGILYNLLKCHGDVMGDIEYRGHRRGISAAKYIVNSVVQKSVERWCRCY